MVRYSTVHCKVVQQACWRGSVADPEPSATASQRGVLQGAEVSEGARTRPLEFERGGTRNPAAEGAEEDPFGLNTFMDNVKTSKRDR